MTGTVALRQRGASGWLALALLSAAMVLACGRDEAEPEGPAPEPAAQAPAPAPAPVPEVAELAPPAPPPEPAAAETWVLTTLSPLRVVGDRLYVSGCAHSESAGLVRKQVCGLWESDGQPGGTTLVPASADAGFPTVHDLVGVGDALWLTGRDEGGYALWKTDGTAEGTKRLVDLVDEEGERLLPRELVALRNRVLIVVSPVRHDARYLLWLSDGTPAGTGMRLDLGLFPRYLDFDPVVLDGEVYFRGPGTSATGTWRGELWKSDGTRDGTVSIDPQPGGQGSSPNQLFVHEGRLYFTTGLRPEALWRSNGTRLGTERVMDFAGSVGPGTLEILGGIDRNLFLFYAEGKPAYGADYRAGRLWKTDGTRAGTVPVVPLEAHTDYRDAPHWAVRTGLAYFVADDGAHGRELWRTDGTEAGTAMVKDIYPGPRSSRIAGLVRLGAKVVFVADHPDRGRDLWSSTGTELGTRPVLDTPAVDTLPDMQKVGELVFYRGRSGRDENAVWRSDGTPDGTFVLRPAIP